MVFAAITPLLFLGSVIGRMKFRAWLLFVPLWITFVYTVVNAKLLWGGGFLAQHAVRSTTRVGTSSTRPPV